ncbi:dethiobiotin synthase [Marinicella gelatinilytica]|uniref:dethiobiotin synthase n=1 Tax=Marinicella gelatinilytica TaxID=2996017 RepID=UPI002260A899|nr:dethiobiotin synthase [Marinicella gelatinilytica]MCX7545695.1 dethiobiotin synthase [Marinicella gelatinilytica]
MRITDYTSLPSCFITATDTDAGKTHVACQILNAWKQQGFSVAAFKPMATGASYYDGKRVSEDAQHLAAVTGQPVTEVNPYLYDKPASPHIADSNQTFSLMDCLDQFKQLQQKVDRILVEGVGGWCVPLSNTLMLKDLATAMALPVVLVSRIGLGCINHTLLSYHQIQRDCDLWHGWIANVINPDFTDIDSNITAIEQRMTSGTV